MLTSLEKVMLSPNLYMYSVQAKINTTKFSSISVNNGFQNTDFFSMLHMSVKYSATIHLNFKE